MGQVIHIFRKDVRHFWREILLTLALLALYTWREPRQWLPWKYSEDVVSALFGSWFPGLIVLSWFLLILRVIHDESLVGDRQFWVTRPYQWKWLLVEKILFLVAFINVPLFIAHIFLLWRAEFSIAESLPSLLLIQAMWLAIAILPMTTMSTVTASLGQTALFALGTIVFLIALGTLSSFIHFPKVSAAGYIPQWLLGAILLTIFAGVIVWQYHGRETGRARICLTLAVVIVLLVQAATPPSPFPAERYVVATPSQAPAQIAFDSKTQVGAGGRVSKDKVTIQIPLKASGVPPNSLVKVDGTSVEVETAGGMRWNSGWAARGFSLGPNETSAVTDFELDKNYFEKAKSLQSQIHIWFATTVYEPTNLTRITLSESGFAVPGKAHCWIHADAPSHMLCRSAIQTPFLVAHTTPSEAPCQSKEDQKDLSPDTQYYGWNWNPYKIGAGPEMSPVEVFQLQLQHSASSGRDSVASLCPGSRVSFATLEEGTRSRFEITIDSIRLADYEVKDIGYGRATGIGWR